MEFGFQKYRSSRWQMYFRIGVLKNFAIFTGKHQCWSLFLINMQAWTPATLLKRDSNIGFFLWNLQKFLRTPFFTEHIHWLLLEIFQELSLYYFGELWMVSFRGTYWLSSHDFILLRVFCFFLFLSFFLIFSWILLLFGFEVKFVNT